MKTILVVDDALTVPAQQPTHGVGSGIAERARHCLDPLAHLGPHPLGMGEDVRRGAERDVCGTGNIGEPGARELDQSSG